MKLHFLSLGAFITAPLFTYHQMLLADPILEGGARMSTLIPTDTVGVNIHSVTGPTRVLKCTKHDNHAVSLPMEVGDMLIRMGLATLRSDVGTGYYALGSSVIFQTTEQQLPLSYVKDESLQLVPHLGIKDLENKLLVTANIQMKVVIQLWGASLEKDYDQFNAADDLCKFIISGQLPSSDVLRCRSLPTGIGSSILLRKEKKWNSAEHRYLTLPFDAHYLKIHPNSYHQEDDCLHFYSLVHFDEPDGLHSILPQHILHLPDLEERKAYWRQILSNVQTEDNFPPKPWEHALFCSKDGLSKCREWENRVVHGDLPHTEGKFRIAMFTVPSNAFLPWALRMGVAAESLGWEWSVAASYPESQPYLPQKDFLKMFNPHCIIYINTNDNYTYIHKRKNFLFFDTPHCVCQSFRHLRYDGILSATTMESLDILKPFFKSFGRRFFAVPNYPSICGTTFSPSQPKKLFYCGSNWDDRGNAEYFNLWRKLSTAGYFEAYGQENRWRDPQTGKPIEGWKGTLPFGTNSVPDKARECGISLVAHGKDFRETGCITARLFEAIAGGTVIICDKHSFVEKHFGNSVLYIDTTQSADEIFNAIDRLMRWIRDHPLEAQELARRSHQIFLEHFTLEKIMRGVRDLYDSIMLGQPVPGSKVIAD
jgi:hypothetical protein